MLQVYQKLGLIRKIKQERKHLHMYYLKYTYQDVFHYTSTTEIYGKTEEEAYDAAVLVLREKFPNVDKLAAFITDGTCTDVEFDLISKESKASLRFICHQFTVNIVIYLSQNKSENIQLYDAAFNSIDVIRRYRAGEKIVLPDALNAPFDRTMVKVIDLIYYKKLYTVYRYLGIIETDLPKSTDTYYSINYIIPDHINRLKSTGIDGVTISFDFSLSNIVDTISRSIPDEWRQLAEKIVEVDINRVKLSILPHKRFNIRVEYKQDDIIFIKKLRGNFLGKFPDRHYLYRSLLRDIISSSKINQLVSQFVKKKLMISPRMVIYDSVMVVAIKFTYKISSPQYKDVLSYTDTTRIISPSSWHTIFHNKFLRKMRARVPYEELKKVKINFKDDADLPQYPDVISSETISLISEPITTPRLFFKEIKGATANMYQIINFDETIMFAETDEHGMAKLQTYKDNIRVIMKPMCSLSIPNEIWKWLLFDSIVKDNPTKKFIIYYDPAYKELQMICNMMVRKHGNFSQPSCSSS